MIDFRRSSVIFVSFALFVSPAAVAAEGEPEPIAAQVEGYLGGTVYDIDGAGNESGFNGGGTGSVVVTFGPIQLQMDTFGDYADPDPDFSNVGWGGHLGLADPEVGAIAMTGGYNHLDIGGADADLYRVGGEVEAYLDKITVGMLGGVTGDEDGDIDDFYYVRGFGRLYLTPNLKLEGGGGYADIGQGFGLARLLAEFRLPDMPVSVFARWEAAFSDNLGEHAAVAGIRLMLDGNSTLQDSDRTYFRDRCIGVLFLARLC